MEPGETPGEALRRELAEELAVDVAVGEHLGTGTASARGRTIRLDVYAATLGSGRPVPHEHAELRWVAAEDLDGLRWAEADVPVVPRVVAWLRAQGASG